MSEPLNLSIQHRASIAIVCLLVGLAVGALAHSQFWRQAGRYQFKTENTPASFWDASDTGGVMIWRMDTATGRVDLFGYSGTDKQWHERLIAPAL